MEQKHWHRCLLQPEEATHSQPHTKGLRLGITTSKSPPRPHTLMTCNWMPYKHQHGHNYSMCTSHVGVRGCQETGGAPLTSTKNAFKCQGSRSSITRSSIACCWAVRKTTASALKCQNDWIYSWSVSCCFSPEPKNQPDCYSLPLALILYWWLFSRWVCTRSSC